VRSLLLAALGPALAAQAPPGTAPHRVVRLSAPGAVMPVETSIALDPAAPERMVAVSAQFLRTLGGPAVSNFAYASADGGAAWRSVPTANPRGVGQGDDVVIAGPGVFHHVYLGADGFRDRRAKRGHTGLYCTTSRDGGATWEAPVPLVEHINSTQPFEDKPGIAVDTVPDSPRKGALYAAWTRFEVYGSKDPLHKSHIYFTRSLDGGRTFDQPLRISDTPGTCVDDSDTVEGAVPAVGPKGEVYVVWSGPRGLVFCSSTDGGETFGKERIIGTHPGGWDFPVEGLGRANGMPVTKVDLSKGPRRGTIYVNWIDQRNGDPDVFVMGSKDGGATWSEPVRVNDDPVRDGKAQFFTWMAVDPADGSVNVAFYDRRGLEGTRTGLTLARSLDGGKTWRNHRVDLAPFECNPGVFFGDYLGVDAVDGRVAMSFMHFTGPKDIALSAAIWKFRPGSQEVEK